MAGFGMNILRAEAFSNRRGMVMDTFIFADPMRNLELNPSEVDRLRASDRSSKVGKLLDGVDYQKASEGLIPYCLTLMQNVPDNEQQKLVQAVKLLDAEPIEPAIKVRILGLLLMNVVGPNVLSAAVDALREQLK